MRPLRSTASELASDSPGDTSSQYVTTSNSGGHRFRKHSVRMLSCSPGLGEFSKPQKQVETAAYVRFSDNSAADGNQNGTATTPSQDKFLKTPPTSDMKERYQLRGILDEIEKDIKAHIHTSEHGYLELCVR